MKEASVPVESIILLQRTLAGLGIQASPWALVEACRGDLSLASFAQCAREQGLEASVLRLEEGDLAFLAPGTIVAFEGQTLAAVVAHDPDGVLLENADGTRQHVGRGSPLRPAAALEVRPAALDGKRFLERLTTRVSGEAHVVRAIVFAATLSVVLSGLGVASPVLTHVALAEALPDRAINSLTLVALATMLLGVQAAYLGWLRRRAVLYLTTKLSEKASLDVVSHMLRLPFAKLRALDVGVVRQAASSAAAAAEAIPVLAPQLFDAVLGLGFLIYAFLLDPVSAAVAAGAGLFVVLLGLVNGRRRASLRRTFLASVRAEQHSLFETVVGIETVKSESVEGRMHQRWLDRLLAEEKAGLDLRLQQSTFSTLLVTVERIVFAAVLLLLARRCLAGQASVADLVAALQATAGFMGSAQKLSELPAALSDYWSNVERVDNALAEPTEKEGSQRAEGNGRAALRMRDVWFRYSDDSPWVLSGVDLVVPAGETVILSWPSGAGKSTLLRLLAGLLAPTCGDVLVHGVEATRARRIITYVPQHATLFPGSVMENLRILSAGASRERILAAAETTGLLDVVSTWGMGLETVISLGVTNVSSGQKQLILFTAAAASETPFVLLDEALAHVDLKVRARLGAANIFRGRTVVAVVHDASPRDERHARVIGFEQSAYRS